MTMHQLESVSPVRGRPYGPRLVWDDERTDTVDLSGVVHRYAAFAALRDDPRLFRSVKRIDRGYGIAWSRQMDYSAQRLRRLVDEQRPMPGLGLGWITS